MFQQPSSLPTPAADRPFTASEFAARLSLFRVVRDKNVRPRSPVYDSATAADAAAVAVVATAPLERSAVVEEPATTSTTTKSVVESRIERLRVHLVSQLDGDAALASRVIDAFVASDCTSSAK